MTTREITLKVKGEADLKQITSQLGDLGQSYDKIKVQFTKATADTQKQAVATGNAVKQLGGQFRSLGTELGLAMGLSEVVGLMKQFGAESIAAARESAGATAQLEAVLKSTGGVAGMTKGKLDELAGWDIFSGASAQAVGGDGSFSANNPDIKTTTVGLDIGPDLSPPGIPGEAHSGTSYTSIVPIQLPF